MEWAHPWALEWFAQRKSHQDAAAARRKAAAAKALRDINEVGDGDGNDGEQDDDEQLEVAEAMRSSLDILRIPTDGVGGEDFRRTLTLTQVML